VQRVIRADCGEASAYADATDGALIKSHDASRRPAGLQAAERARKENSMLHSGKCATLVIVGLASLAAQQALAAEEYTSRPSRLLATSPAGGPSDYTARLIAPTLSEALRRNVVVDNRPSVNGVLAAEITAKATPDGSTLIAGNNGTHAINPFLYKSLAYDPIKDFTPVCQLIVSGSVLVGSPKLPAKTFQELIAAAKKEPGKLNIGVPGANSQVSVEMLKSTMGIKLNNIPFKGSAPTEFAIISSEVDIAFISLPSASAHLGSGRMKGYATSVAKRSPLAPNVPTFDELGVHDFRVGQWHGLWGPAGLPDKLVRTMYTALGKFFAKPEVRDAVIARGSEIIFNSPEEFAKALKGDMDRYGRILREAGYKPGEL
jgi:tripartite-type tricarboxylate transporter receptor subunit TctC